jgi:hypothetical protein
MDANRFDHLARSISGEPSRRSLLGLLAGGGIATLLPLDDILAKRKKRKKKNKKKRPSCTPKCAG